ncbi:transcription factor BHLH062-like isoform X1 [Musa acuminata AAA Group]|uniref:transcription factor BHLH062-like isoform X1 n=1 Tax=Musa acuminata AAA Group TaxID=214697 RepID=UPI0031CFACEC
MVSDDPSTTINESNVAAESTVGGLVATERNELKDENTTLQAEISQLQKELQGRSSYNPTWSDNINSMTPTQPQPTATGLPMLHRPVAIGSTQATPIRQLQHFSGGKNKHSTTNAAWAFPGDETTCQISDFIGLAAGSSPLDFSPGSQEERCGSCGISTSSEEEGCNTASTGCGANSASASHGGGPHAEPAAPQCSCSYRQPSD